MDGVWEQGWHCSVMSSGPQCVETFGVGICVGQHKEVPFSLFLQFHMGVQGSGVFADLPIVTQVLLSPILLISQP